MSLRVGCTGKSPVLTVWLPDILQGTNVFPATVPFREAFNAMPATTTADMWSHQYVQMANQIYAGPIPETSVPFSSNSGQANMFGLEPNFGCCTANFNQAWPKFVLSAIMQSEKGMVINTLVPALAEAVIQDIPVRIKVLSEYPFRDEAVIEVWTEQSVEFILDIRIPGFAHLAWVDGKKAGTLFPQRNRRSD